jgi:hypothetical protein
MKLLLRLISICLLILLISRHTALCFVRVTPAATKRTRTQRRYASRLDAVVSIRDFQTGDAHAIQRLLLLDSTSAAATSALLLFDPEGPLSVDCGSDATIQESYLEDDGCFLVAISNSVVDDDDDDDDDNNNKNAAMIVGTAGLVIGTAISYLPSGASLSTPTVTGAVRRVCGKSPAVCQQLLVAVETRAANKKVEELIALAYPPAEQQKMRPTTNLMEALGYERSESQLPGTDVVQYAKRLDITTVAKEQEEQRISNEKEDRDTSVTTTTMDGRAEALVAGVLVFLLVAAISSVAQFMGLDTVVFSGDSNNHGSRMQKRSFVVNQNQSCSKSGGCISMTVRIE